MSNYQLDYSGEEINNSLIYENNYNFLINPTFTINQREGTSYSGEVYSVDRWKLGNSLCSAEQSNDIWTFAISGASTASSRILMKQTIENYKDFAGLKVTASIKYSSLVESVSGTTQLSIYDGVNETTVDLDSTEDIAKLTHTVNTNPTTLIYRIKTKSTGTNISIVPKYCKLEIGENATVNYPRNISDELRLCKRYYIKVFCEGQAASYEDSTTLKTTFILPSPLRTTPTIIPTSYPIVCGYYTNGTYNRSNSTQWQFSSLIDKEITVFLTLGNNTTTLNALENNFYCLKNGYVVFDAEIS